MVLPGGKQTSFVCFVCRGHWNRQSTLTPRGSSGKGSAGSCAHNEPKEKKKNKEKKKREKKGKKGKGKKKEKEKEKRKGGKNHFAGPRFSAAWQLPKQGSHSLHFAAPAPQGFVVWRESTHLQLSMVLGPGEVLLAFPSPLVCLSSPNKQKLQGIPYGKGKYNFLFHFLRRSVVQHGKC